MPAYDFKCSTCNIVKEFNIKLADYDNFKTSIKCSDCDIILERIMDFKGNFTLSGNGWADMDYGITDMETDFNQDQSNRAEDMMHDDIAKRPKE